MAGLSKGEGAACFCITALKTQLQACRGEAISLPFPLLAAISNTLS